VAARTACCLAFSPGSKILATVSNPPSAWERGPTMINTPMSARPPRMESRSARAAGSCDHGHQRRRRLWNVTRASGSAADCRRARIPPEAQPERQDPGHNPVRRPGPAVAPELENQDLNAVKRIAPADRNTNDPGPGVLGHDSPSNPGLASPGHGQSENAMTTRQRLRPTSARMATRTMIAPPSRTCAHSRERGVTYQAHAKGSICISAQVRIYLARRRGGFPPALAQDGRVHLEPAAFAQPTEPAPSPPGRTFHQPG
jgi:hypothetical protein